VVTDPFRRAAQIEQQFCWPRFSRRRPRTSVIRRNYYEQNWGYRFGPRARPAVCSSTWTQAAHDPRERHIFFALLARNHAGCRGLARTMTWSAMARIRVALRARHSRDRGGVPPIEPDEPGMIILELPPSSSSFL